MSRKRLLLVGYGRIGREVFSEFRQLTSILEVMVTDPLVDVPAGFEWDGDPVNLAMVMVDTPALTDSRLSGYDYHSLCMALGQSLDVAEFVIVRSTVELGFLEVEAYLRDKDRIGFSPEFYGTTRHSRRGKLAVGFAIFSDNVPAWFVDTVCCGRCEPLAAPAAEVIVAKLAENAFLATKVTFFHELAYNCRQLGLSFERVRELVTADPRITPHHSFADDGLGWSSHCFDKDVPTFADLGNGSELVEAAMAVNDLLLEVEKADPFIGP